MRMLINIGFLFLISFTPIAQEKYTGPIIDMHLHAYPADANGPPPLALCVPVSNMIPHYDPKKEWMEVVIEHSTNPDCKNVVWSPKTDEELIQKTVEQLKKYNVTGVLSGTPDLLPKWLAAAPDRFIPSLKFSLPADSMSIETMTKLIKEHNIQVIGEIGNQYHGIAPDDPRMDPYWALAEKLDIPVAIHLGSGLPGATRMGYPNFRVKFSDPLLLEEVLNKYPRLRVSVMHYGEPFLDELIAMLFNYPQLYIDLGGIPWGYPNDFFYDYQLKKIVAAGFSKRIMFGSDAMNWPDLIGISIDIINEAPFLTLEQKEDIFYNNAARFLRLDER